MQKSSSRKPRVPPMNLSEDSDEAPENQPINSEDGKQLCVSKNQYVTGSSTVNTAAKPPIPSSSSSHQHQIPNTSKKKSSTLNSDRSKLDHNPARASVPIQALPNESVKSETQSSKSGTLSESTLKQLNQPDRISKEKQKFFRHSAFNSGRVAKNVASTSKAGSNSRSSTPAVVSECKVKGVKDKLFNEGRHNDQMKSLSDSSSSCSSSDNDDDEENEGEDDESSSSDSCSSSSSCSDSSGSSSACTSSDEDDDEDEDSDKSESKSELSALQRNQLAPLKAQFKTQVIKDNPFQAFGVNIKDENWGFAAEAKKNVDIFSAAKGKDEKLPGLTSNLQPTAGKSCSGSTAKVSSKKQKNSQLKGLFDGLSHIFTTSDYSRASIKNKDKPSASTTTEIFNCTNAKKEVLKETRSTFRDYEKQRIFEEELKRQEQGQLKKTDMITSSNKNSNNRILSKKNHSLVSTGSIATSSSGTDTVLRNSSATSTNTKKRIAPISLPLEQKPSRAAEYSSEDDYVPYLTQKTVMRSQKLESKISSDENEEDEDDEESDENEKNDEDVDEDIDDKDDEKLKQHLPFGGGFSNVSNQLDFASLSQKSNMFNIFGMNNVNSPAPYNNNNQSIMGKELRYINYRNYLLITR